MTAETVAGCAPLTSWVTAALDLIFPAHCPVCRTALGDQRRDPLCGACWAAIARVEPPWCILCGIPRPGLAAAAMTTCPACAMDRPSYDWARAAASYEGPLREALHAFKFGRKRALAQPLAALIAAQCGKDVVTDADVLVPVPLSSTRERERGFNQAALLADRLSRVLRLPARARWLVRTRATPPQSDLSAEERRTNVRDAFAASTAVAGHHVVVVDDVLTTGATAAACAVALKSAGARMVGVVTVARVI